MTTGWLLGWALINAWWWAQYSPEDLRRNRYWSRANFALGSLLLWPFTLVYLVDDA